MKNVQRTKRYIHLPNGEIRVLCPGVPVKRAKVVPADPEAIARTNRELAKKCQKQRENNAEALAWAKTHGCC